MAVLKQANDTAQGDYTLPRVVGADVDGALMGKFRDYVHVTLDRSKVCLSGLSS